jgi:hypothetical protein
MIPRAGLAREVDVVTSLSRYIGDARITIAVPGGGKGNQESRYNLK